MESNNASNHVILMKNIMKKYDTNDSGSQTRRLLKGHKAVGDLMQSYILCLRKRFKYNITHFYARENTIN